MENHNIDRKAQEEEKYLINKNYLINNKKINHQE